MVPNYQTTHKALLVVNDESFRFFEQWPVVGSTSCLPENLIHLRNGWHTFTTFKKVIKSSMR
ncbi:Transient receptor potential cation channel subfamily V member 4 [Frankliniella fusca]|uniref:Transient receptor potential cation channel subfamily V member 4 n=1 Tax=Frankliniella fusca TaxID=407009 RepID=A0AAE1LEE7_9NEOP|nr:Transient receptor potential cation channel subfamily V member 4 [Frankliniella fusca]